LLVASSGGGGGALILASSAVGSLGFLGALVTTTLLYSASACSAVMLMQVCLDHRSRTGVMCRNLGDVGALTFGRWGRVWGHSMQVVMVLGYCSFVILQSTVYSLSAADFPHLPPTLTLMEGSMALLLQLTVQARTLTNLKPLTALAFFAILLSAAHLIHQASMMAESSNPLFSEDSAQGWKGYLTGLAICMWTFNPMCLSVEVLHAMANPAHFSRTLLLVYFLSAALFLGTGGLVVWNWGWNPPLLGPLGLYAELEQGSRLGNSLLALSIAPACTLLATPAARALQKAIHPRFKDDWSFRSIFIYFSISLPVMFLAWCLATIFPLRIGSSHALHFFFFVLSLILPMVMFIFPPLVYRCYRNNLGRNLKCNFLFLVFTMVCVGFLMLLVVLVSFFKFIGVDFLSGIERIHHPIGPHNLSSFSTNSIFGFVNSTFVETRES